MPELDPNDTQKLALSAELFRKWLNRRLNSSGAYGRDVEAEFFGTEEYKCAIFDWIEKHIQKWAKETLRLARHVSIQKMPKVYLGEEE